MVTSYQRCVTHTLQTGVVWINWLHIRNLRGYILTNKQKKLAEMSSLTTVKSSFLPACSQWNAVCLHPFGRRARYPSGSVPKSTDWLFWYHPKLLTMDMPIIAYCTILNFGAGWKRGLTGPKCITQTMVLMNLERWRLREEGKHKALSTNMEPVLFKVSYCSSNWTFWRTLAKNKCVRLPKRCFEASTKNNQDF